jgi:hypothetical protein
MELPKFIDDEDVRLWIKELVLAGKEVSCIWRPGKRFTMEAADDAQAAAQLDHDAVIEIWADEWEGVDDSEEADLWDAKYSYYEIDGKTGWWRT